jgi:endo-1,4-beta-D-glucanase Y
MRWPWFWEQRGGTLLCLVLVAGGAYGGEIGPPRADVHELLQTTWTAYVRGFIREDGRVVDARGGGITTSEGQAYAMLRSVWMEDRGVFDRTLGWALNNLNRGVRSDALWAWKWGPAGNGSLQVLDPAFASDADQDAVLALIMATRTWNDDGYLRQARAMLTDLWDHGTVVVKRRRFLLGGDRLCQRSICRLNPSYYAPYAYRVFAHEDPGHDWSALVETAYSLLSNNSALTATRLPSDWVLLDLASGRIGAGSDGDQRYSYDALRVPWRVELDAVLYKEARARAFLRESLAWPAEQFRREQRLSAVISSGGQPRADYEALEMLAAMIPALRDIAPDVAAVMDARLQGSLRDGFWGDRDRYYLQNWAWFGTALDRGDLTPFERVR